MTILDDLAAAAKKALAASLKSDGSGRLNVTNYGAEWNTLELSTTMCRFIAAADPTTVLRLVAVARLLPDVAREMHAYGLYSDHGAPETTFEQCGDVLCAESRAALAALDE